MTMDSRNPEDNDEQAHQRALWRERYGDMVPEKIVDTKIGPDGRRYYKVQWASTTMEPGKNFLEAELLIKKYWDPVEKKLKLPSMAANNSNEETSSGPSLSQSDEQGPSSSQSDAQCPSSSNLNEADDEKTNCKIDEQCGSDRNKSEVQDSDKEVTPENKSEIKTNENTPVSNEVNNCSNDSEDDANVLSSNFEGNTEVGDTLKRKRSVDTFEDCNDEIIRKKTKDEG